MSLPKITTRAPRVIRIEVDPYLYMRPKTDVYVWRKICEDGTRILFAGDNRVCSIRSQLEYLHRDPNFLLYLADGTAICLKRVSSQEGAWLEESMEETV